MVQEGHSRGGNQLRRLQGSDQTPLNFGDLEMIRVKFECNRVACGVGQDDGGLEGHTQQVALAMLDVGVVVIDLRREKGPMLGEEAVGDGGVLRAANARGGVTGWACIWFNQQERALQVLGKQRGDSGWVVEQEQGDQDERCRDGFGHRYRMRGGWKGWRGKTSEYAWIELQGRARLCFCQRCITALSASKQAMAESARSEHLRCRNDPVRLLVVRRRMRRLSWVSRHTVQVWVGEGVC